jgi:hypothetical protein
MLSPTLFLAQQDKTLGGDLKVKMAANGFLSYHI